MVAVASPTTPAPFIDALVPFTPTAQELAEVARALLQHRASRVALVLLGAREVVGREPVAGIDARQFARRHIGDRAGGVRGCTVDTEEQE